MTKTIQELAGEVCDNMVYDEDKKIYHQKHPGDPQWIQDMIHDCHYSGMLPDDFVFEQVFKFCSDISQLDLMSDPFDDIEIRADEYSHDLLKWFSSNLARADFVDDILNEQGCSRDNNIFLILGMAQEREMQDILFTVIDRLQDELDMENGKPEEE